MNEDVLNFSSPFLAVNVLLIKPYQKIQGFILQPPLGLLYLASAVREALGRKVNVKIIDAKAERRTYNELAEEIRKADIVGLSSYTYEKNETVNIARLCKSIDANKIVAVGGPWTFKSCNKILSEYTCFDWAFNGEAEISFPETIKRFIEKQDFTGIKGFSFKKNGIIISSEDPDIISDLDQLPLPAWDLLTMDHYTAELSPNRYIKGKKYAPIMTSRGCPYHCSYCHGIFGKEYRVRSPNNVIEEMKLLTQTYGVDEIHFIDDIFNLRINRVVTIFNKIKEAIPGKIYFCFPNGVRGDLLTPDIIPFLIKNNVYHLTLAIETSSERLQTMISKHLNLEQVKLIIKVCDRHNLVTEGFFMFGFPTETLREIFKTLMFVFTSSLTFANFFIVIPQYGTRLYEIAFQENPQVTERIKRGGYHEKNNWYELSYRVPLSLILNLATIIFFFAFPKRIYRIYNILGLKGTISGFKSLYTIIFH